MESTAPAPIGEPITTSQNDPNFLNLAPSTPADSDASFDIKPIENTQTVNTDGLIPLSPPPRRTSRQLVSSDHEQSDGEASPEESGDPEDVEEQLPLAIDIDDPHVLRPPPEVDDFAPSGVAL